MLAAMKKKDDLSGMSQIGVRLPPPAVEEIDAIVDRRNAGAGWKQWTRSDVLREAVEKGLVQIRADESPPAPTPAKPKR